jgi:periplasmic divalent cation tolerance protein
VSRILLVRTTFGDPDEAARIARLMIDDRLAACASLAPTRSIYHWQGAIETDDETVVLFKTMPGRATALTAGIGALHSYELPVIESWEAEVDPAVAAWIEAETAVVS